MRNKTYCRSGRLGFISICLLTSNWISLSAQTDQTQARSRKWNLSFSADYLGPGNGKANLTPTADIFARLQKGYPTASFSASAKAVGAEGFRVAFFRAYKGIEIGPSFSYLNGGPGTGNTTILGIYPSEPGPFSKVVVTENVNALRLMLETRKTGPLFSGISGRIGAGVGAAVVNKTTTATERNGFDAYFGHYTSFGWLTWELSPALLYKDVSLGLRYVGFGRGGKVPWNTLGAFFGVDF